VGCTFLDWSIHFLSGQTNFFNIQTGWQQLSKNPLKKINAHGHQKNTVSGPTQTEIAISKLQNHSGLSSFYLITPTIDIIATELDIDPNTITQEQQQSIQDYSRTSYNQSLVKSSKLGAKIIFVSLDKNLFAYANAVRTLEKMPFENCSANSEADITNAIDQLYFRDSAKIWKDLDLNNIWDLRERMALRKNLFEYNPMKVELDFDHCWVDSQNLWYNGEREIPKILAWLELPLNQNRYEEWKPIYRKWQEIQVDALQFQYDHKHIVDCIINNWSYTINLTFEQEAFVQHCLIYQHNLNLKTWQLEKFPNNTQELHKLLETNIHPL
jgi:hypothetical protein